MHAGVVRDGKLDESEDICIKILSNKGHRTETSYYSKHRTKEGTAKLLWENKIRAGVIRDENGMNAMPGSRVHRPRNSSDVNAVETHYVYATDTRHINEWCW